MNIFVSFLAAQAQGVLKSSNNCFQEWMMRVLANVVLAVMHQLDIGGNF